MSKLFMSIAALVAFNSFADVSEDFVAEFVCFKGEYRVIQDSETDTIKSHGQFLLQNPEAKLLLESHAGPDGTPEHNVAISEERARAVKTYMENEGVDGGQINLLAWGENAPFVSDNEPTRQNCVRFTYLLPDQ